ncbi:uncharacterized protein [Coffea arabica]|uniref:Uncharacterized protein LOC113731917 n=1 Tax=Coffea arabica TaxID=13443 RepID=A0A6P6WDS7_COFAR|nr:uncharacterized protein LOC113731917 [Coffea arabica]XP_027113236.1 uncharacterized protein LOC113731917 [Coffea arabica]
MEDGQSDLLSLKVLVEKEKKRVVFLEADKYFLDVLSSFMTMPLAMIIKLTRGHSLKGEIGCLSSLYESVENLGEDHLQSTDHKDMLLHPRSAAEIYHSDLLKDNSIERTAADYYACSEGGCTFLSYYRSTHCRCGSAITLRLDFSDSASIPQERGGFVKPTVHFMISDDFQVMPMSTKTGLALLEQVSRLDGSRIEERNINIGRNEVLKLLKHSLVSRTPFTDTLLEAPMSKGIFSVCHGKYGPRRKSDIPETIAKKERIILKLIVCKSKNKAIYAEAKEDFVNLLCSFLTFPLGYVFSEFPSLSFKGCINNFYQTIKEFDSNQFMSEEMKEAIVYPKLAPGLPVPTKLIAIMEAVEPSYSTFHSLFNVNNSKVGPKSNFFGKAEGFIKGPSMFMVTDNLTVTPLSAISGLSLINKLRIPLIDIEEQQVDVGEDEALRLLVATLVSKYTLTDAFLHKEEKQES